MHPIIRFKLLPLFPFFYANQELAEFFSKGLDSNYSRLCGSYALCSDYSTLPL